MGPHARLSCFVEGQPGDVCILRLIGLFSLLVVPRIQNAAEPVA